MHSIVEQQSRSRKSIEVQISATLNTSIHKTHRSTYTFLLINIIFQTYPYFTAIKDSNQNGRSLYHTLSFTKNAEDQNLLHKINSTTERTIDCPTDGTSMLSLPSDQEPIYKNIAHYQHSPPPESLKDSGEINVSCTVSIDINSSCTVSMDVEEDQELLLTNILINNEKQQTNGRKDEKRNTIVINSGDNIFNNEIASGHRIPTTAHNSPKSENVSLLNIGDILTITASTEKSNKTQSQSSSPLDSDDRTSTNLSPYSIKHGHRKLSTIIITQHSTDSELLLVAPPPSKNPFYSAQLANDQSFDMDVDFTNFNDPKYFIDSAAALHGFAPSVEIHNDGDLMINLTGESPFGLPIERLPREMRSASVETLDADFILEPAYFQNAALYENNNNLTTNGKYIPKLLTFSISRCSTASTQTAIILDAVSSVNPSTSANTSQSARSSLVPIANISHAFSTSVQMSPMLLNQSFQWTKPGLPIDHVCTCICKCTDIQTYIGCVFR